MNIITSGIFAASIGANPRPFQMKCGRVGGGRRRCARFVAAAALVAALLGGAFEARAQNAYVSHRLTDPHGNVVAATGPTMQANVNQVYTAGVTTLPYVFLTVDTTVAGTTLSWFAFTQSVSAFTQFTSGEPTKINLARRSTGSTTIGVQFDDGTHFFSVIFSRVNSGGIPYDPVLVAPTSTLSSFTLNWTAPDSNGAAITGYKVRWATAAAPTTYINSGGSAGNDVSGGASARTHTIPGLTSGTAYQFQVAAVNSHGTGGWSAAQSGTPAAVEAAICIFEKDRGLVQYQECITAAKAGYHISKSEGGAHEFVVVAFLSGASGPLVSGTSSGFRLNMTDDAANPLVADTDIEGALPDFASRRIRIPEPVKTARSAAFTITPKAGGNGGRINIGFTADGSIDRPNSVIDLRLDSLTANQKQETFLQIVETGMNFTAADADGACPASHNAALADLTLAEGGAAGVVCVSLQSAPTANVSLACSVADAGRITVRSAPMFTAANWQTAQALSLTAQNNNIASAATDTLTCIATGDTAYARLAKMLALSVTDTDTVSTTGGTLAAGSISESGGAQMVEITATLGGTIATGTDCTVAVTIGSAEITGTGGDILAAVPGDYATFTAPSITIPAGELSGSGMVEITPATDSDANIESIPLSAAAASCGGAAAIDFGAAEILIFDSGILISEADSDGSCPSTHNAAASGITLAEDGNPGTLCVSLLLTPASDVSVACAAADTALVTAAPAALIFTASNATTAQTLSLTAVDNDTASAADATDTLTCTASADAATGYNAISKTAMLTVTDTDAVSVTGTLSATSVAETGGGRTANRSVTVTATLDGSIAPETDCTVTLTRETSALADTDGNRLAVNPDDYTFIDLYPITIPAGKFSGSESVLITVVKDGDADIESIPLSAAATSCGSAASIDFGSAEILIIDAGFFLSETANDRTCPAVHNAAVTSITQAEGASTFVCVSLLTDPAVDPGFTTNLLPEVATCSISIVGVRLPISPKKLTYTRDTWDVAQVVQITAPQNNVAAGDISSLLQCIYDHESLGEGAFNGFITSTPITVTDDDMVSTSGALTAGNVLESGGAQMVEITATLDGTARPVADCAVTVSIDSAAITGTRGDALAAATADYSGALTAPSITIAAGELSGSGMLAITPVADSDANIESIPLSATAACGGAGDGEGNTGSENIGFGNAEILIIDPGILLSAADADGTCPAAHNAAAAAITLAEGGAADSVCVSLLTDPGDDGPVTITCTVGDAALVGVTASLSPFTTSNWQTAQVVSMRAPDNNVAAASPADNDTLTCAGSGSGDYASVSKSVGLTVTDTDAVSATGTLQSTGIREGGGLQTITITATLSGVVAREICTVTVTPGSSEITDTQGTALAVANTDYTGTLTLQGISIAAGELSGSGTLQLTAAADSDEHTESIPLSAAATSCSGVNVNFGEAEILIHNTFDANVDEIGTAADWKDGVLVARYLLGLRGAALQKDLTTADGLTAATANIAKGMNAGAFDVDGDDKTTAADGIMFARYMLGVRGDALIAGMTEVAAATVAAKIMELLSP